MEREIQGRTPRGRRPTDRVHRACDRGLALAPPRVRHRQRDPSLDRDEAPAIAPTEPADLRPDGRPLLVPAQAPLCHMTCWPLCALT